MITIAITGGIACGKSTVARSIVEKVPSNLAARYDCDHGVSNLFDDLEVQQLLQELDQSADLVVDRIVNRALLRERAFESSEFREKLEGILHPLVLKQVRDFAKSVSDGTKILLVEVPLLYEVDFPIDREIDVVVASSKRTQLNRLSEKRNVDRDMAERIIESQMPLEEKMKRADIVIWNDGSSLSTNCQVEHLVSRCAPLFIV